MDRIFPLPHRAACRARRAARRLIPALTAAILAIPAGYGAHAQDVRGRPAENAAVPAIVAQGGMVVAQERLAANIGADILRRGGNAVDAAVATGFAMAVTYPRAGNLGGGGFMLVHLAKTGKNIAIDYRETAPAAASATMFLGPDGKPDPNLSRASALGIGVPGTVAGLTLALDRFGSGKFSLAEILQPAIALARNGFAVADDTADTLARSAPRFARWPASAGIFLKPDGSALQDGDRLVQSDLAQTLERIAAGGADGFYRGETARRLAEAIRTAGGIMTVADLASYRAEIRTPVTGTYRGHDIVSMPLPSSGGPVLIEMLNILEGYDLAAMTDAARLHRMVEAMKFAYADRARYLGDPDFIAAPVARLTSKAHAQKLRARINPDAATPADAVAPDRPASREGENTTHFSVVDADGNAVSNTYTLNFSYGLGMVADGTGVLLNNELDDFTAAPGAANAYGLVGYAANLPAPGKRPLSSMTPTIVLKDGKAMLVTGSPGGSRIISAVLQVVVNVIDRRMDIAQAVAAPRLHHQWRPDEVRIEQGFDEAEADALKKLGHAIRAPLGQTSANSILVTGGGLAGTADPRTRGALAAGVAARER